MRPYQVYINQEALLTAPRSGAQRNKVMAFIHSLATNPNSTGDFSEKDPVGRAVQVKIVGRFAITFWADHAVSEVKITHVKLADK
jgi:hypothetical protein